VETFLLVVFAFLAGSALAFFATLWWMRWTLRRRNRVVPSQASPAPVTWLAMPTQPARLHRRLQVAVRVVRVHAGMPDRPGRRARTLAAGTVAASGTLAEMVQQLEAEAAALDHEITVVARAPRTVRRAHMVELNRRVLRVEQLAGRVAQMAVEDAVDALPPGDPAVAALDSLSEQLDALQAARAEVAAVEQRAGLRMPQMPSMPQQGEPAQPRVTPRPF
jgi:hypothetical protein